LARRPPALGVGPGNVFARPGSVELGQHLADDLGRLVGGQGIAAFRFGDVATACTRVMASCRPLAVDTTGARSGFCSRSHSASASLYPPSPGWSMRVVGEPSGAAVSDPASS